MLHNNLSFSDILREAERYGLNIPNSKSQLSHNCPITDAEYISAVVSATIRWTDNKGNESDVWQILKDTESIYPEYDFVEVALVAYCNQMKKHKLSDPARRLQLSKEAEELITKVNREAYLKVDKNLWNALLRLHNIITVLRVYLEEQCFQ